MFNLDFFIKKNVTKRPESLFIQDVNNNKQDLFHKIKNKSVLVIGGAGSIGSSFIKALLPFHPQTLVVVDINENGLAELSRDLRSEKDVFLPEDYITYPMSYADNVFIKLFRMRKGFDIVANFSAHKHVRSEKDVYSVEIMLENNLLRAKKFLDLLTEYPPEEFFCVSTDKAANPVNIMGASKRIMEDMIFSYSDKFPVKTARFANVAFSNGSLPLGFIDRINKLQPLSAPSDIKRYFVSPEESGQICMLACMLGKNREIYFPKLYEAQMTTFDKIAEDLLLSMGYSIKYCKNDKEAINEAEKLKKGSKEYPVYFSTSDTTGEKTFEEFYTDSEQTDMNQFISLGVVTNITPRPIDEINDFLTQITVAFTHEKTTKEDIVNIIKGFLPNFKHSETGKNLDQKM